MNVRELQFKIVHFIYFTDSIVSKFDNTVSAICGMCNVENNLFHTFYHCTPVNKFWAEISAWHHRITNKFNSLSVEGILLGYNESNFSLNLTILYGKYYIHKCNRKYRYSIISYSILRNI